MATKHMVRDQSISKQTKKGHKKKKSQPNVADSDTDVKMSSVLKNILALGGDKSDLSLLEDIEDEDEALDEKEDLDVEPIKKDEIRNFIKNLGIRDHRPTESADEERVKKEKPVKLAVMPSAGPEELKTDVKVNPKKKERKNKFKSQVQDGEVSSTTELQDLDESTQQVLSSRIKNYKPRKHSLLKSEGSWYEQQTELDHSKSTHELSEALQQQMDEFASKLLRDEVDLYKSQRERFKKSETNWIKTVLTSGTIGDKMAALTLLVQDSPVHNLSSLDSLIAMASKKGKRENIMAVDTLKELFQSELIPSGRKLRTFKQNSLYSLAKVSSGDRDLFDRTLLLWGFESQFKERYSHFIKALEVLSFDTVPATKQKALSAIYNLLVNKPEQEKRLLGMLVNKVGDPDHKMASKSSHLLSTLVEHHPNMKTVVVKETEQLLYRSNISSKAQYYSICFLNQLALNHGQKELAKRLIDVFFSFFKAFVKKGEVDSKIMSALLTGVNRVYPFAKVDYERIGAQMNTLYQIVHVVNFNTSLQALMLLYQVMDSSQSVSDRYYMALYKKLLDPALKTSSKQTMFLNLLYKSLNQDVSEKRIKAFVKRLLQVCSYQSPPFICATLILLSEVIQVKRGVLQVMNLSGKWLEDDDDDEHFADAPEVDSESETNPDDTVQIKLEAKISLSNSAKSSWIHRSNLGEKIGHYDAQHRNPLYCSVEQECVWELTKLTTHYHPSVALFAQTLLQNKAISYSGDPLHDFALIRFLDRFVYKNPKKQRTATAQEKGARFSREHDVKGVKKIPVNSEEYLKKDEKNIPVEEKFFYKYFQQKAGQKEEEEKKKKKSEEADDSDVESVSDDEFEDFLDDYEKHIDGEGGTDVKFDFAGEFDKKAVKGKSKKGYKAEFSDDDSDDDLAGLSDEEIAFSDDDDFKAAFQSDDDDDDIEKSTDFDEEDVAISDDDDELTQFEAAPKPSSSKRKAQKSDSVSKKVAKMDDTGELFAAAEEFSHLIDENTGTKFDQGTTQAMANKDNAHFKQLDWEVARDKWVRGADWKSKRMSKKGSQKFNKTGKSNKRTKKR